jgi:hypothetical protein
MNKVILAGISGLFATVASAATIEQSVDNIDWNAAMWGSTPAAPTSGNDYVAKAGFNRFRISADGSSSTFGGDSLTIDSGALGLIKLTDGNTATVSGTLTLNGGSITHGPNSASNATLATGGFVVSGTGSTIGLAHTGVSLSITGGLSGAGDLLLHYADTGSPSGSKTLSFDSVGAYTGTISVTEQMQLDFGSTVNFGGNLTIASDSFLNVDQSLTFNAGALTFDGAAIAAGTYTGVDLTNLGAGFIDGGGTLTVVPEPGTYALIGGLLALCSVMVRRRK